MYMYVKDREINTDDSSVGLILVSYIDYKVKPCLSFCPSFILWQNKAVSLPN